jgi:alpha-galactosidase
MENCASGAGRADLAMTRFFGRMNRSDNQDALDMLKLHYGFTQVNLPRLAGGACHISDSMYDINRRRTPLQFQAFCGMLGSLAIGKDLTRCSEAELDQIRSYGERYKKLRTSLNSGLLPARFSV